MLVRDIMASPPVTASPEMPIIDAARLMKEHNIGSLIVEDPSHRPLGIVTERDLVGKGLAEGLDPKATLVRELMSSPLLTIPPDMDVLDAAKTMARHHVRRLPVLNGARLMGVLSERDILEVSPDLIEVTRIRLPEPESPEPREQALSSCDNCNGLTDSIKAGDGRVLCGDCWGEWRDERVGA